MVLDAWQRAKRTRTFWGLAFAFWVFIAVSAMLRLAEGVEWMLAVFMTLYLAAALAGMYRAVVGLRMVK